MKRISLILLILGILGMSSAMAQTHVATAQQAQQTAQATSNRAEIGIYLRDRASAPGDSVNLRGMTLSDYKKAKLKAFRKQVLATQIEQEIAVDKVIDGDTFEVVNNGERSTYRLAGIDAPEEGQENWKEAKDKLSEMILGKKVTVKYSTYHPKHVNGFYIVRVSVGQNDAGSFMLSNGWAWYDKTYGVFFAEKENETNEKAMKNAQSAKSGIWKSGNATEPWVYFEKTQPEQMPTK